MSFKFKLSFSHFFTLVMGNGRVVACSPEWREQLKTLRDQLNEDGLRVVAVGYKALAPDQPRVSANLL